MENDTRQSLLRGVAVLAAAIAAIPYPAVAHAQQQYESIECSHTPVAIRVARELVDACPARLLCGARAPTGALRTCARIEADISRDRDFSARLRCINDGDVATMLRTRTTCAGLLEDTMLQLDLWLYADDDSSATPSEPAPSEVTPAAPTPAPPTARANSTEREHNEAPEAPESTGLSFSAALRGSWGTTPWAGAGAVLMPGLVWRSWRFSLELLGESTLGETALAGASFWLSSVRFGASIGYRFGPQVELALASRVGPYWASRAGSVQSTWMLDLGLRVAWLPAFSESLHALVALEVSALPHRVSLNDGASKAFETELFGLALVLGLGWQ